MKKAGLSPLPCCRARLFIAAHFQDQKMQGLSLLGQSRHGARRVVHGLDGMPGHAVHIVDGVNHLADGGGLFPAGRGNGPHLDVMFQQVVRSPSNR